MSQEDMLSTWVDRMDFDVLEEKENVFFARKELQLSIKHPKLATPKKQELVKELSEKYSVPEDQVVVDFIFSKKGLNESVAKVKIYKEKPKIKQKKEEKPKGEKSEAQASEAK
jgi:ribosomal protein S24E